MANQYKNVNATATTEEQNVAMDVNFILFIANDALSGNLLVGFEGSVDADDYFMLKPGETLSNIYARCTRLYYKASAGNVAFRCYGIRNVPL